MLRKSLLCENGFVDTPTSYIARGKNQVLLKSHINYLILANYMTYKMKMRFISNELSYNFSVLTNLYDDLT